MTKEKVACIAGTPVDTAMGVDLINKNGYDGFAFPSSKTPTEETFFQMSSCEEKNKKILSIIGEIKRQHIEKVLVYCNSLSAAIDFDKIANDENIKIVTPFHVYVDDAKNYKSIGIIAANAVATSKIEKVFMESNKDVSVISIGMLPLVYSIESKMKPKMIVEKHHLKELCKWFKDNGADAILLGCTHFPYIYDELKKVSELPLINPSSKMIELLRT